MAKRLDIDNLRNIVANSTSYGQCLDKLGRKRAGGSQSHLKRVCENNNISVDHFTGQSWRKDRQFSKERRSAEEVLVKRDSGSRTKAYQLRRALIDSGVEYKCTFCGQPPEWRGNSMTLDVDHVNQDWLDDRKENLRFLCPNCHSQLSRGLIEDERQLRLQAHEQG